MVFGWHYSTTTIFWPMRIRTDAFFLKSPPNIHSNGSCSFRRQDEYQRFIPTDCVIGKSAGLATKRVERIKVWSKNARLRGTRRVRWRHPAYYLISTRATTRGEVVHITKVFPVIEV